MTGPAVAIRTLQVTDAPALLAFEAANRPWFEEHIAPRDADFYSQAGVAAHVAGYLADHAAGIWHPFVMEDADGNIVGRANLKDIDGTTRTAEVGYRIARDACGRGLATLALRHLIEQARTRWQLEQLFASVYADNLASRKVLERCGFEHERTTTLDRRIDGRYRLVLPPAAGG